MPAAPLAQDVGRGLAALGAQQEDIRPRFLKFAADFFGQLARGEKPPRPDTFVAEIAAQVCAGTVGAEVPLPLQAPARLVRSPKEAVATNVKLTAVEENPAARAFLASAGQKKAYVQSRLTISLFMAHPDAWLRSSDIAEALGKTRKAVTALLWKLHEAGALLKQGNRSTTLWKLAETPHV